MFVISIKVLIIYLHFALCYVIDDEGKVEVIVQRALNLEESIAESAYLCLGIKRKR